MKNLILSFLLLFPLYSISQTLEPNGIFSSAGNHMVDGYAQISWTLGDCQTRTYRNSQNILTQGFLQTRIIITNIPAMSGITRYSFKVYPNPVKDILYIQKDDKLQENTILELYSQDGKVLIHKNSDKNNFNETIDFGDIETGIYLLIISSENLQFRVVYKIIFQNE